MNRRQTLGGNDMIADDWQLAVTVVQQAAAQQPRITLKSSRPNPRLIATSHKLAALKRSSLSGLSIKVRACFESRRGSPAAHRRRCVSSSSFMHHRRKFALFPPCPFGQSRPAQRSAPP